MGFHVCEFLTREEAAAKGFKHLDVFFSSGEVTLHFASGRSWKMPDMATLYIELGWLPPVEFIEDVLGGNLIGGERQQTRSATQPISIGYLNPRDNPLPLVQHPGLPADFSDTLSALMQRADRSGYRAQSKGDLDNLR